MVAPGLQLFNDTLKDYANEQDIIVLHKHNMYKRHVSKK